MNMIHLINESFAWLGVCVCVWVCTRAKLAENRNYCPFEVNVFIIRRRNEWLLFSFSVKRWRHWRLGRRKQTERRLRSIEMASLKAVQQNSVTFSSSPKHTHTPTNKEEGKQKSFPNKRRGDWVVIVGHAFLSFFFSYNKLFLFPIDRQLIKRPNERGPTRHPNNNNSNNSNNSNKSNRSNKGRAAILFLLSFTGPSFFLFFFFF